MLTKTEIEKTTAHRTREWIVASAPVEFSMRAIASALGIKNDPEMAQISAALTRLAKYGFIKPIGKTASRGIVYSATRESVKDMLDKLPSRRKPRAYERNVTRPPKVAEKQDLPLHGPVIAHVTHGGGIDGQKSYVIGADFNPTLAHSIVNDLIGIGVHIETNGLTRQSGLELLRLTERVFRGAK